MRYALKSMLRKEDIFPFQFGVGSKGGVEPILEFIQQSIDSCSEGKQLYMISLDQKNAFNLLNRLHMANSTRTKTSHFFKLAKYAYGKPSPLVVTSGSTFKILGNSQGTRQGGPEANLLFTIGIGSFLEELIKECLSISDKLFAYLDNIYIIIDNADLILDLEDYFTDNEQRTGCKLNQSKCEVIDLLEVKTGADSIKTLGACIGTVEKRREFLQDMIKKEEKTIVRLKQMPKQHCYY